MVKEEWFVEWFDFFYYYILYKDWDEFEVEGFIDYFFEMFYLLFGS